MANTFSDATPLTLGTLDAAKRSRSGCEPMARVMARSWTELVSERRSIRRYRAEAVEGARLERILSQATWAPSAHNRQPWRFAIVEQAKRRSLAEAMGAQLQRDRLEDGDDPEVVAADVSRSTARLTEAPALVLACLTMSGMDCYPDARRAQAEFLMAVQSTAMAVQNLLLATSNEGLGACVLCAPLFCPDAVLTALDLPREWRPQCLITMGWPASEGKAASRKPLHQVLAPGVPSC
jgi:coenzyme F420-0:L-glutamate ligase / coenzyme F420-1:gamma-L-glutamate ligase